MSTFTVPPAVPLSGIISPRPVTIGVQPLNRAIWYGTKAERDAELDRLAEAEERQRNLDAEAEKVTEGRVFPSRPNRHDD